MCLLDDDAKDTKTVIIANNNGYKMRIETDAAQMRVL